LPALDGHERACACGRFEHVVYGVDQGRATFLVRPCSDFARHDFCHCMVDGRVQDRGEAMKVTFVFKYKQKAGG